jgi:hypothetical protein
MMVSNSTQKETNGDEAQIRDIESVILLQWQGTIRMTSSLDPVPGLCYDRDVYPSGNAVTDSGLNKTQSHASNRLFMLDM